MSFTWYGNQSTVEGRRYGALAIITPLMERMQIASIINQHLPADPRAEYDYGTTLSLLMAARLYSPMALINVAEWAKDSGADVLWNMPPEKINDDPHGDAWMVVVKLDDAGAVDALLEAAAYQELVAEEAK